MIDGQAALTAVQYQLVEPPDGGLTWPSEFWTATEMLWYLNQRQQRFLIDTGCVVGYARFAAVQGQLQQTLPSDWLRTITLAFITEASGAYRALSPVDALQLDFGLPSWPTVTDVPIGYTEHEDVSLTVRLVPAPSVAGLLEIVYIALAPTILGDGATDGNGDLADLFVVPPEFVGYLLWGVLADALGKIGRGHDPERAAYAEMRYQEGVAIARLLLYGGN